MQGGNSHRRVHPLTVYALLLYMPSYCICPLTVYALLLYGPTGLDLDGHYTTLLRTSRVGPPGKEKSP